MSMRLSALINQNKELIIQEWENFARAINPSTITMDSQALRDHIDQLLCTLIRDIEKPSSLQDSKPWAHPMQPDAQSYAHKHAAERLASGYTIHQLVSEFRALRTSVLFLLADNFELLNLSDLYEVIRFNKLLDQVQAESVARYAQLMESIILDEKRVEQELRESNQHKDEFIAMLAHELRNPLAPISTAGHLLSLSPRNESTVRQASDIINRQVVHLAKILDDLLDVARITQGLIELHTEPLDLKLVVSSAIEQSQPIIDKRGHALVLHLDSTPMFVEGDMTRLVQALSNLLNNAAKYTPLNGEITLVLQVQGDQAKLIVKDNGNGIAPSFLPHIFELFTQAARTPDRIEGGLGLGLSLVKNIIALHKGMVEAKSQGLGKGSVFTITLPLLENKTL